MVEGEAGEAATQDDRKAMDGKVGRGEGGCVHRETIARSVAEIVPPLLPLPAAGTCAASGALELLDADGSGRVSRADWLAWLDAALGGEDEAARCSADIEDAFRLAFADGGSPAASSGESDDDTASLASGSTRTPTAAGSGSDGEVEPSTESEHEF
jgi:hypothetical protein